MHSAIAAMKRLQEGNRRFFSDDLRYCGAPSHHARRSELISGQKPFAVILGCADSRVPAEIIFDQGLGDLFVIRVAGNIVGPSQIGSVEFAADHFGTQLVVVLGHSRCGAVSATLTELQRSVACRSPGLCSIVNRIRPVVEALLDTDYKQHPEKLLQQAVRRNIQASTQYLRQGSQILRDLIQSSRLFVIGAEYSVETGRVDFFEELPQAEATGLSKQP